MPRLPPRPVLSWTPDGAPHADDIGDVYFSGDGLSEKRAVFLGGCGLPDAWAGRDLFVVAELGFGAGINLLALWDLWRRHRPHPAARLHMISVEGALMSASDAARVHARWPELSDLSTRLLQSWPDRARGLQRIALDDGVTLDLFVDDVAEALPQISARAHAWFLDGFAPSKNPDMWSPAIIAQVARLSAPGARLASYTVAGELRRGLAAAGFEARKVPGHGRKKERLEATYNPVASPASERRPTPAPRTAIIAGAGVAGAWMARALTSRGCAVTVVDADTPGAGASGNPVALVMPRLDASDTPVARALVAAFLHARRAWMRLSPHAVTTLDITRLPASEIEASRFEKLAADPPLDDSFLTMLDADSPRRGLLHRSGVAVRPEMALAELLNGARVVTGAGIVGTGRDATGAYVDLDDGQTLRADLVVICAGMGLHAIAGAHPPPLEGRLGQIEHVPDMREGNHAIADGGYAVSAFGDLVFGATFEPASGERPVVQASARLKNLETLARLRPDLAPDRLEIRSRAAIRATTPDRLPFAGMFPRQLHKEKAPGALHSAAAPAPSEPDNDPAGRPSDMLTHMLVGGLGSRGFLWAPLLAEHVASLAMGEPSPLEHRVADLLDPDRFRKRAIRRRG